MVVLASVGFSGSLVFYNAYLPEIAEVNDQDRVSAKGYALGYIGSIILLLFNLSMIMAPEMYGISDDWLPARISFLSVGLWWAGFAQITFSRLPKKSFNIKAEGQYLLKGYQELLSVFNDLKTKRAIKKIPHCFFCF